MDDQIIDKTKKDISTRIINSFLVNNLLLASGLIMIFSGLVLQLGFHMGGPDKYKFGVHEVQSQSVQYEQLRGIDTSKIVCGFNYSAWSDIHKYVVVFFFAAYVISCLRPLEMV
jgi:hypothetical protein